MMPKMLKCLLAAAILLRAVAAPAADRASLSEAQVKVAYLYNFASFVEWPASALPGPGAPLNVGVLGKSPFGDTLNALSGRTVRNHKIQVRELSSLEEAAGCQVVFVAASEQGRLRRIVSELAGRPVLTVSDLKLFAQSGGIIGLVTEGGRIRFEINLAGAEKAGLKVSSQLLRLATSVLR